MLLTTILEDAGIPLENTALLRHRPTPGYVLWRTDRAAFERYQAVQLGPKANLLKAKPYWVSFVAEKGEALFVGVYEARFSHRDKPEASDIAAGYSEDAVHDIFLTTLRPDLDWLRGRMKIDWAGGSRNWVQKAHGNLSAVLVTGIPDAELGGASRNRDAGSMVTTAVSKAPPLVDWIPSRRGVSNISARPVDLVSWITGLDRRSAAHEELLRSVVMKAAGRAVRSSTLVDLVVDGKLIIEIKSVEFDSVAQVRAALAQLYHYRFLYRNELPTPTLLAVFGRRPEGASADLVDFLDDCAIAVAWEHNGRFEGTPRARESASWLFT